MGGEVSFFLAALRTAASVFCPYVDSMDQQVMFAEKSWESNRVLDVSDQSMTVKVTLNPGHGMNYHSHERRDEGCSILLEGLDNPIGDYLDLISSHSFF